MLYLPDNANDTTLGLFVQGVTFDAAALCDRLREPDEAHDQLAG